MAEGRIKWGFFPPDFDVDKLPHDSRGIWIGREGEDAFLASDAEESEASESESEGDTGVEAEHQEEMIDEEGGSDVIQASSSVGGKFGALSLDNVEESEDSDSG